MDAPASVNALARWLLESPLPRPLDDATAHALLLTLGRAVVDGAQREAALEAEVAALREALRSASRAWTDETTGEVQPLREARRSFERAYLEHVLERVSSRREAAALLGVTREGLRKKLIRLGLRGASSSASRDE